METTYKDEQLKRMGKFVVNGSDMIGYKIDKILAKGDEYVIYEILGVPAQESIRIYIDTIEEADIELVNRVNEIKPHFDEFLSIIFKYGCDSSYKNRASNAVAMAINGKVEEAKTLFDKIKLDAKQEYSERILGRLFYQSGALIFSLMVLSIFIVLNLSGYFSSDGLLLQAVFTAALFSSFGGFLSIYLRLKEITIDRGLSRLTYLIMGAFRSIISVIGGIFLYFVIKSNLAFGFLNSGDEKFWGIMVFCFLAGFSETLVPNTLRSIESKSQSTENTSGSSSKE